MLENLDAEQDLLLDQVAEEYVRALTEPDPYDPTVAAAWLRVVYRLCDLPYPDRVEVVASPEAAFALAETLVGAPVRRELDGVGVACASWVARYDAYHRLGVLSDEEVSEVFALRAYLRCAWDHVLLDECAIVVGRPVVLQLYESGNLHSVDGPAITWSDGERGYAHHGVWISEQIALRPRTVTREEYLAISDTEVRRALAERAGWEWIASLLGASVTDVWTDPATGLRYELLGYSEAEGKLLRKQSPALQDGSQPWYVEPVHEDLMTARAARKWQAGEDVVECEDDPSLEYEVET